MFSDDIFISTIGGKKRDFTGMLIKDMDWRKNEEYMDREAAQLCEGERKREVLYRAY